MIWSTPCVHLMVDQRGRNEKGTGKRGQNLPKALSAASFFFAFGASSGIALLMEERGLEEKEGDTFSRRLFTSALSLEINVLSLVKNDFNFASRTWIKQC